jgi:hypothetical protein
MTLEFYLGNNYARSQLQKGGWDDRHGPARGSGPLLRRAGASV